MALYPLFQSILTSVETRPDADGITPSRDMQELHLLSVTELHRGIERHRRAIAAVEGPVTFSGIPPETAARLLRHLKHGLSALEQELDQRGAPGRDDS